MTRKAIHYTTMSQLSLYFFMGLCVILNPHFAFQADEGGLSNYGLYAKTVLPYTLGLGLCGLFIMLAGQHLPRDIAFYKFLHLALYGVGVLLILELFSTYSYKVNPVLKDVHIGIGTILLLIETMICALASFSLRKCFANTLLFVGQLFALALVTLALTNVLHILLIAELAAGLSFGVILLRMMLISSRGSQEVQEAATET